MQSFPRTFAPSVSLAAHIRTLAGGFPPTETATPEGLLCQGGSLLLPLLLAAYSRGIFPWFLERQPILWWTPSPRCVLEPRQYHLPKRSARAIRQSKFTITLDHAFERVIDQCRLTRLTEGTWITPIMRSAYLTLYRAGFAHSIEAWHEGELVGGLYGVALGRMFYGESMFHHMPYASRACLAALNALLVLRGVTLLDCQQETAHVMAQGAMLWPRERFEAHLAQALRFDAQATDALTQEYLSYGQSCAVAWPFLIWKTSYSYGEQGWQESGSCVSWEERERCSQPLS